MPTPLSKSQIAQLKVDLQTLKIDILGALESATERGKTVELDQQLAGRVSRMDAIQQQQMAKANSRLYQQKLAQINAALKRIQSEEYGYCTRCDDEIPYPRLNIRPESPLCMVCQEASET